MKLFRVYFKTCLAADILRPWQTIWQVLRYALSRNKTLAAMHRNW